MVDIDVSKLPNKTSEQKLTIAIVSYAQKYPHNYHECPEYQQMVNEREQLRSDVKIPDHTLYPTTGNGPKTDLKIKAV